MSSLHSNGVITGYFNGYCLLCEVHITKEKTESHILEEGHKEKFERSSYVKKYQSDHIRKVNVGYYCEFCNILVPTMAHVELHVSSENHERRKGIMLLKEVNEGVIAYREVLIGKKAWHGLVGDTCMLCNVEYTDESQHLENSAHILQLIQQEVVLKNPKIVYRDVNGTIHCLICNINIESIKMKNHFESEDHLGYYRQRCEEKNTLEKQVASIVNPEIGKEQNTQIIENVIEKPEERSSSKDKDEAEDEQNTRKENNQKPEEIAIEESEEVVKHKGPGGNDTELVHPFAAIEKARSLCKQNHINYKPGKQSAYCKICNVTISSSIKMIKDHIEEEKHMEKLKMEKKKITAQPRNELLKVPMCLFIDTFNEFQKPHEPIPRFVAINRKILVSYLSFLFMTFNGTVIRCQACEVNVQFRGIELHVGTPTHMKAMIKTDVVFVGVNEFVREVRAGHYHCGYCNLVLGNIQDLYSHLSSQNHKSTKEAKMGELFLLFSLNE
ncbi:unnamed protein product [Leptosia nina]|uniref:C2H2-type domain-containing protein n=1 Tax=Leptosia nina TaxID=320188 RepID=A0AAV1IV19_9NEOP